ALHADEDHRRSQFGRQAVERAKQACIALAQLGLAARRGARVDRDGELETRIVERVLAAPRAIASRVERAVDRHAVNPREELAAAFELRERAIRLEEDF